MNFWEAGALESIALLVLCMTLNQIGRAICSAIESSENNIVAALEGIRSRLPEATPEEEEPVQTW